MRVPKAPAGITLIELLVVVALVSLLVGITFPAIGAGLDSLRLVSSANRIASFLNAALNRVERRQQVVVVSVWPQEGRLSMRSTEAGFERSMELDEGVSMVAVHPELPYPSDQPRRLLLLPGGAMPRLAIELRNRRGARRLVSIDPITGVTRIEVPEAAR